MIAVLDIGGTSIKYGVLQETDGWLDCVFQDEVDSNAKQLQGPGIVVRAKELIVFLQEKYQIDGIAISTAGMVDAKAGVILYANENIPAYTGMNLKHEFESCFQIPCWVENDVNAAALGEFYYGAGTGTDSMLMLTIGTGIGGAIVLQGEIYHGHSGSAGEIGYMWMDGRHFQDVASTTALVHNTQESLNMPGLNGRKIFNMAKEGNMICRQNIENLCETIIKGVSNCVCMLNPQVVVLGGGIMTQSEYLRPIMNRHMEKYLNEEMLRHTRLEFAKLANTAGMVGAYAYFQKKEKEMYA